ncbi:hypothetical protein [Hymenobacter wooponensis]|uniref:Lipoprotein n=1 Tax=Hymenobacter wooponensis TaxID=1525360 RepID=A0A4Z0MVK9_9BACT|nr:hypothetical protein [Hymenobacter wooponensis]TGD83267.1 hypothetical protein EU557_05665 [Hymenobacter wooponensis]
MRTLYSSALLGLSIVAASLSGCQKEEAATLPLACVRGKVLGNTPCNGVLIELLDGPAIGRPLSSDSSKYQNVFGTFSSYPDAKVEPGQIIQFSLRNGTADETSRMCLAIYPIYNVPQFVIEAPRCQK